MIRGDVVQPGVLCATNTALHHLLPARCGVQYRSFLDGRVLSVLAGRYSVSPPPGRLTYHATCSWFYRGGYDMGCSGEHMYDVMEATERVVYTFYARTTYWI